MKTAHSILEHYWHFTSFRNEQEAIIHAVAQGHDTVVIMPTGGGKSLCYQIPTLMSAGNCIVITPLVALMKDQVQALKQRGIPAVAIHAGLSKASLEQVYEEAANDQYRFIYVSPERLQSELIQQYVGDWNITLLAVDEAHCISQWGYDFRPAYLTIATIRNFLPPKVPVIALTGSATKIVQQDIEERLGMKHAKRFLHSFERSNISLSVNHTPVKINRLLEIVEKINSSTLIYCNTRRRCQEISETLQARGYSSTYYHAGLSAEEKDQRMQAWLSSKVPIMVCTNAFGMGIDKPDVRLVVHVDVPDSPESFYQEIGRAGRDGQKSWHVLLFHERDLENLKHNIDLKYPDIPTIKSIYKSLCEYLQIAIGDGNMIAYEFQLGEFAANFKYPVFEVLGALKILEQHNMLFLSDAFHRPSRVEVTASREAVHLLERDLPALDEMLKFLLRTYPGIMQFDTTIDEFTLARSMEVGHDYIIHQLRELSYHGFIAYQERSNQPQITLLHDRVPEDLLQLNVGLLKELKKRYEQRVLFMISYCQNNQRCRKRYLLSYFEEFKDEDCGTCDRCILKNKKNQLQKFEHYKTVILQSLKKEGFLAPEEFAKRFPAHEREPLMKTARILLDEQYLMLNKQGHFIRYA